MMFFPFPHSLSATWHFCKRIPLHPTYNSYCLPSSEHHPQHPKDVRCWTKVFSLVLHVERQIATCIGTLRLVGPLSLVGGLPTLRLLVRGLHSSTFLAYSEHLAQILGTFLHDLPYSKYITDQDTLHYRPLYICVIYIVIRLLPSRIWIKLCNRTLLIVTDNCRLYYQVLW